MRSRLNQLLSALRRPKAFVLLALVLLLGYGASGIYTVPANSVAVTRALGVIADPAVPPGMHWWWPRPIGTVEYAEVTRTLTMPVGYYLIDDLRNVPPSPMVSRWLTGDTNIIEVRANVQYRIAQPAAYLFGSEQPREILRYVAGSAFTEAANSLPVDDLLTSGRLALLERVRARTQELLDAWGVGLQVLAINLEAIEPPQPVLSAFQEVQNARADRERLVSEAEAYTNTILPVARGDADRKVNEALAFREQRVNAARGDAERFARLAAEHRREPRLMESRLYLETIERVLPRVRRYVLDQGGDTSLPLRLVE